MFIVLHCGGMPFNGNTVKERSLGGSESAAYYVARELVRAGHKVTLFTTQENMSGDGKIEAVFDGVKYIWCGPVQPQAPLGVHFHAYAENTPHDVLLIQRHPYAFRFNWACKVGLWWLHDIALGRMTDDVKVMSWNFDAMITVSPWHRQQVIDTWGVNPEFVRFIQNGVDLSLFDNEREPEHDKLWGVETGVSQDHSDKRFKLLYAGRPERGLENLLKEGGIMERLAKEMPRAHLYTCAYANTVPQMEGYYAYLDARAKALPNVTSLGALSKQQLADVMRQCDLYVYPTAFEDTSCIAMMECAAAGLPVLTSNIAALPHTTKEGGAVLIDLKDGAVDVDKHVEQILHLVLGQSADKEKQLAIAPRFDWKNATAMLLTHVEELFAKKRSSNGAILRGLVRDSDIYAAAEHLLGDEVVPADPIIGRCEDELDDCYQFAWSGELRTHYEAYYEYEKRRGVNYGPESLDGNTRFEFVSRFVGDRTRADDLIVDYGCAHGHYTVNLARRYPDRQFVGIDIAQSNVDKARAWAEQDGIKNVRFYRGEVKTIEAGDFSSAGFELDGSDEARIALTGTATLLLAAEVLEHAPDPRALSRALCQSFLRPGGHAVFTTPYGPWEAQGFREHHPWRAHLHHLERADIHELWGAQPDFGVTVAPGGQTERGETVGSYITTFTWAAEQSAEFTPAPFGHVDYERKFKTLAPRQTLSVCYIVRNAESTLRRSLQSIEAIADEVLLAVDRTTDDRTREIISEFKADADKKLWPVVRTLDIDSPLETGFAAARNASIKGAVGDWIMWLDSDEIVVHEQNIAKYLRINGYDGYAVKQHHFTVQPPGVQKTDLPCRLFRNYRGVQFFGEVHEHPEVTMNKGVGHVMLIGDVDIAHEGYTSESIRQKRFERNLPLMVRDREKNPTRVLGKFLWIRDIAQMCAFEVQRTRRITPQMQTRAKVGLVLFDELLKDDTVPVQMLVEVVEFYTVLVNVLDQQAVEIGFEFSASKLNGGVPPARRIVTKVASLEHAELLMRRVMKDKVLRYESKYF